jgi:hypothetical protein
VLKHVLAAPIVASFRVARHFVGIDALGEYDNELVGDRSACGTDADVAS